MRRQCEPPRPGIERLPRDIVPIGRIGDLLVQDMVDRLCEWRDGPAGVDQPAATPALKLPPAIRAERDILPADLAHAVRGRGLASGL